jgi:membrane protein implicated in regulation of membrane protease activity
MREHGEFLTDDEFGRRLEAALRSGLDAEQVNVTQLRASTLTRIRKAQVRRRVALAGGLLVAAAFLAVVLAGLLAMSSGGGPPAEGLWLVWLGLALGFGIAEVLSLNLIFLMVSGGGLGAAAIAGFGAGLPVEIVVFAATTAVLLLGARPPLLAYVQRSVPAITTNTAALVGRNAQVLVEVTTLGGRVKLAGEVWSARSVPTRFALEVGSTVEVVRIEGATAVVAPLVPRAGLTGAVPPEGPDSGQ